MTFRERFGVGWRLLRPFTLTASIIPGLIGTSLAFTLGKFNVKVALAFLLACVFIQAATNMFNEYFDFKRGLDTKEMVGIAGTIVHDGVTPKTVLRIAWTLIALSVLLGVYICAMSSWAIALVGTACLAVAYFYSGGPKPLAYTPFGELAASIAMGPVIVLIGFFIQTGRLTTSATMISLPIGLLIGAILLGNNIRDMEQDKIGGRRTLVILLGRKQAARLFAAVFIAVYGLILALIAAQILTLWALLVMLTIPTALYVTKQFFKWTEPSRLHKAVKGTAVLLLRFGGLMFIALTVSGLHW